jgi:hypothetical protein
VSFMQQQITTRRTWYEIDTNCGTWFVDTADVDGGKIGEVIRQTDFSDLPDSQQSEIASTLLQYTEGNRLENVTIRVGIGARLSAPGYLDCTEWTVFETEREAREYLAEMYGDEDEEVQS